MAVPKIQLACDLVGEEFGLPTRIVCSTLMERGESTLDEIVKFSGLERLLVCDCLLSGIQHNYIVVKENYKHNPVPAPSDDVHARDIVIYKYSVLIGNILIRIRFSLYTLQARDKLGFYAENIISQLLLFGRANISTLLSYLVDPQRNKAEQTLAYLDAFKRLKDSKYIVQVMGNDSDSQSLLSKNPSENLDVWNRDVLNSTTQPPQKRKMSSRKTEKKSSPSSEPAAKRFKHSSSAEHVLSTAPEFFLYQEANAANDGANSQHLGQDTESINLNQLANSFHQLSTEPGFTDQQTPVSANVNLPSTMQNVQALMNLEKDESRWCVNYNRFNFEACKDACIQLVAQKIDISASEIIKEMFEINESSRLISEERLFNNLTNPERSEKNPATNQITKQCLKNYLDLMTRCSCDFLIQVQPSIFTINLSGIVQVLKQNMVESIILSKFDRDGLRIFRLLRIKKLLEQKQVSEMAMIPIKETRDCLYKMLSQNYVQLQEVPRTSDHRADKMFYLWNVRWDHVMNLQTCEIYKIMRNLRHRLRYTLQNHADLINKKKEEERIFSALGMYDKHYEILTPSERQTLEELTTIQERLEISLIHLDETLMTLIHF
ncbi:DNA-directed RNA polymerase III subunit rpc3-like [Schistocerca gregaria]|uniref:DNA-directed RNA polymerase III subunit rpc3-like n=1 Tax=Schistocerca gregaria TaxID=7010 RepID=UPI00211E0D4B|nr:DNA-directed RNA polymerase III subunit rpc3-like [Schistocerca gregaria]